MLRGVRETQEGDKTDCDPSRGNSGCRKRGPCKPEMVRNDVTKKKKKNERNAQKQTKKDVGEGFHSAREARKYG